MHGPGDSEKNIKSQVQRLARNAVALAVGGIVAQLAFTLLEILVARKLGAEAYGVFVTAYAWTVLGSCLIEFGTPWWTIQEGSRDTSRLPALLGSALFVNLVAFGLLYLALFIATNALAPNPVMSLLLVILPYGLILTLQSDLGAIYSSHQTMHVNAFFQGLAPVAILLVYFTYSPADLGLSDVAVAYVVGGAIVTGAWFALTLRKLRPHFDAGEIRTTLRCSYQYAITAVLGQVYLKVDVVMLSALAGLREAGIYAAAFKLVELVLKVAVLAGRVFAPAMFKASHESDKAFQIFASMMTRFLAVAGLLAGVLSFVLAEELILFMFGDAYDSSVPVLRILAGVMAAKCMIVSLQLVLSSMDLHAQRVRNLSIAVAAHIVANAALIPEFGALGAAFATLFSGVILIVLYAWSASRRRGFRFGRWLVVPACLAVVVGSAAFLSDVNTFLQAGASFVAFLTGLYLVGFVHRGEIRFVLQSLLANKQ